MAIIARFQRRLSPPTSPSLWGPTDLTDSLPSDVHLRTPLPRTDSETRRGELAKQLARDDEPVSITSSGGEDAGYLLAKAVMGRYVESYFPGIEEHQVMLERGVEAIGQNLRQRKRRGSGYCRSRGREKDVSDSVISSLASGVEVEWMIWSRIAPPAAALYALWVVFVVWRKLDDGEPDFLAQFSKNDGRVETWMKWALVGLFILLCVLALIVWAIVEVIRVFLGFKLDPPSRGGKST